VTAPEVGRGRVLIYGLPGLPLAILGVPLYIYLPPYYAEILGIGAVGALLLAARLWDVVTDPLIGAIGDRLRSPIGRRKLMILIGMPLLLVAAHALFRPPDDANALYLLSWSFLAYLGWTMVALPYTAWGAELSDNYDRRSLITASREGCIIAGLLLAIILPAVLVPAGNPGEALRVLSTMLWVSLPVAVVLALVLVPELRNRLPEPDWRKSIALLRHNRPFLRLITAYLLNGLANALPATLFLLYAQHVLIAENWAGAMLIVYFLAGILGMPLFLALARRIGKHRAWTISMLWASLVFIWVPFLGEGAIVAFLVVCALAGLSLGVDMALPASIQADLVDMDTAGGGGRRAGLFFGLWGMATKTALALAVGIAFPLLAFAGFDAAATPGEASGTLVLALLYGLAPVPFKLIAARLMWNFPIDRSTQGLLRERIRELEEGMDGDRGAEQPISAASSQKTRD